jgi:hypothetical protein
MTRFPFAAWFLDRSVPIGEQDREWVACFYVLAADAESAKNWGDTVANAYCSQRPTLQFVRSYIDNETDGWTDATPAIAHGEMPTDEQIGW